MGRQTVIQETLLENYKDTHWTREFKPKVTTWTDPAAQS